MRLRTLFGMLALVSLFAMAIVTFLLPDPPEVREAVGSGQPNDSAGSFVDRTVDPARGEGRVGSTASIAIGAEGTPVISPIGWPSASLEVRVHEEDGSAAVGASVKIESEVGPHLDGLAVVDERGVRLEAWTDVEGSAHFDPVPVGPYVVVAESSDRRVLRRPIVLSLDDVQLDLVLPPDVLSSDLVVRVLDPEGAPVPDADVQVFGGVVGASVPVIGEQPALSGRTEATGVVRFPGVAFEGGTILATAPDERTGLARVWLARSAEGAVARGELSVTLSGTGRLEGALTGLAPDRMDRARVVAYSLDSEDPYRTTHGVAVSTGVEDGRYRFDELPAGTWTMSIDDPGGARLVMPAATIAGRETPNSLDPIEVSIVPGTSVALDLEVTEGGVIEGMVLTEAGAPVVGALVRDTFAPKSPNVPDGFEVHGVHVWRFDQGARAPGDHPVTHSSTRTDSSGRYELLGLAPGRHRLEVLAEGLAFDRRSDLEVEDGRRTTLEHMLAAAGAIQGVEPRSGLLGVTLDGREEPLAIAALPSDGRFTFAGLAPGSYTLSRFRADEGAPGVPLATVEVEAGRTTWIDLARAERRVRFLGRVVDAKGPVSGVRVRIHPESFTTDREGRFEMRSSFPLAGRVSVQVRRDPVETWYSFQGMSPEMTSFEKEFVLGNASVIVRTVDEGGSPAAARLDLALAGLGGAVSDVESLRFQPIFVDESGERRVDGLLAGDYTIRARFDNGAECVQAVAVNDAAEIVMQRPPSGDLEVRVRETDNQPAVGRWISVQVAEEDRGRSDDAVPGPGLPMRWCETDVDGLATFRGVGAGTIVVQVRARRGERSGLDSLLAEETAALAAGETKRIEVDLSAR